MQTYETVILLHPRLSDPEVIQFSDGTKQMIAKDGGEIVSEDRWGRRKLAYPIGRSREGYYLYFRYHAPGAFIGKLSRHFRLLDTVMRTLTVVAEQPRKHGPRKAAASAAAESPKPVSAGDSPDEQQVES